MSDWYEVAVVAESFQQQLEAALAEYGPVPQDERAKALIGQAAFALGTLSDYAATKGQPEPKPAGATPRPLGSVQRVRVNEIPTVIEMLFGVADITQRAFVSKTRALGVVAARRAIAWMLYEGIEYEVKPSLPDLAVLLGMSPTGHATLVGQKKRAELHAELAARMYDECDRLGIKTNPRPDWARKEQV